MDKLRGMETFIAVVESGSFTGAAARLEMSAVMVGKYITQLESQLGTRLLERNTRRQSLTDAGRVYFEEARRVLEQVSIAENAVERLRATPAGTLRVTAPTSFGGCVIAPLTATFLQRYPEVRIELDLTNRMVDLVEEGVDLAIRIGEIRNEDLVAKYLCPYNMVICAAPDYLLKKGTPQSVDDLPHHAAINYLQAGRVLSWQLMDSEGASHTFTPRSSLNMDDLQAICDAALAGHGIAWLPCWMVIKEIHQGNLVPLFKQAPDVRFDVHAVWQQTPHLPLRVRIAIDMLVKRLPAVMSLEFPASIKKPR